MMTAIDLLKSQVKDARETFETTSQDIKKSHLHKNPGGKASTLAAAYAHLIFSEDAIIQGMLQGKTPLYKSTWAKKTGADIPMPEMDAHWSKNNAKWSKSVKVDWPQLQKYAKAVFKATDTYLNSLTPKDLQKNITISDTDSHTVAHILSNWVIGHTHNLAGEISAIKGIFGAKGYQF